ncbi:hypothetical protein RhiTH_009554 [Rhizoctonia solani]
MLDIEEGSRGVTNTLLNAKLKDATMTDTDEEGLSKLNTKKLEEMQQLEQSMHAPKNWSDMTMELITQEEEEGNKTIELSPKTVWQMEQERQKIFNHPKKFAAPLLAPAFPKDIVAINKTNKWFTSMEIAERKSTIIATTYMLYTTVMWVLASGACA